MNTMIPGLVLAAAAALQACEKHGHGKGSRPDGDGDTVRPAWEVSRDPAPKWLGDAATREGIKKMEELVRGFETGADPAALKDSLDREFSLILERCTLQGEAHDRLHQYLLPLKARIDRLDGKEGAGLVSDLELYLSAYWRQFD